jgi:hypothetical protein
MLSGDLLTLILLEWILFIGDLIRQYLAARTRCFTKGERGTNAQATIAENTPGAASPDLNGESSTSVGVSLSQSA